ncbi:Eco29kI family restriction endonuclease [Paraburkholderia nemoris]|uniref:Eco29kI family restriction endonuclease n=1 Tax=Paraburkholderia nemoris TaxID=2793076 RepID=UPI0038B881A1
MATKIPINAAAQLRDELKRVIELARDVAGRASPSQIRSLRPIIEDAASVLDTLHQTLDTVRLPKAIFDPSSPKVVGRFVAMAMLAQDRVPLDSIERFYGAGVYALYYKGSHPAYTRLSNVDHPIYVGKADPAMQSAKTPVDQGEKLATRLNDHRRSIERGADIHPSEFDCRYLVVASGWQEAAESHLIHLYRPVWNSETGICFGIGKHGDSAGVRANLRSPWDTMHPGRTWASDARLQDSRNKAQIVDDIAAHLENFPPLSTRDEALDLLLKEMSQG